MARRIVSVERVTTVTVAVDVDLPAGTPDEDYVTAAQQQISDNGWRTYELADEDTVYIRWLVDSPRSEGGSD